MGFDIYNRTNITGISLDGRLNNTTAVLNRWTPQNTNTNIPRAAQIRRDNSVNVNGAPISDFIEDGSFIRLQNVTLGYNLPSSVANKLGIQALRAYIGGQNLLTFTDYTGFDPEVNSNGQSNLEPSIDQYGYPRAKTYLLGLNLTF